MASRPAARRALVLAAVGALLVSLLALPATAFARSSGTTADHTTATRTGGVSPRTDGVARDANAAAGTSFAVPTAISGGSDLAALRRPGATKPQRVDLPHWLPQRAASAGTRVPARTAGRTPTAVDTSAPDALGLRSDSGLYGLADADDSLLYPDCSVFELCEEPPDPSVAVSATRIVETVNELVLMVDRATGAGRVIPNFDFFSLDNNQIGQSDPNVLYDATRGRWLASEISSDCAHSYLHVAISSTDDPLDPWTAYRIVFPGRVVDFPSMGTSRDAVIVSLNAFAADPEAGDCLTPGEFEGGMLVVIDWSDLERRIASLPVTTTEPVESQFTWRPAKGDGSNRLVHLVVALDNGSDETSDVGYATLSGTNAGRDVTLSQVVNLTREQGLAAFATPPAPRQPGEPTTIERAVDGQPTDALLIGDRLWFVATTACRPSGDPTVRDCVRLGELATSPSASGVRIASDELLNEAGKDLFMAGIGRALDGTRYVVYSRSSRDDQVASWATWRGTADTAFHTPALIVPPGGVYSGTRWGDYVVLSPDPSAPSAVWHASEVATLDGTWFTWMSQLHPAPAAAIPAGTVKINGGDRVAGETFVELDFTNPPDVALTVVRVANGPELRDGVLAAGQTLPVADAQGWSLTNDQPNDDVPDGVRTIYVQWGDGRGRWSPVVTDSIVLDTTAPTVGRVLTPQIGASTLTATGVPMSIRWGSGHDDASGLEGYDVDIKVDGEDWEFYATTHQPVVSGRVPSGHRYQWRVRAFDRVGNVSDWEEGPSVVIGVLDDTSKSIAFGNGWRRYADNSSHAGGEHDTTTAGATATFSFTGRTFALVALVGSGRGALDVRVDGHKVGTFFENRGGSVHGRIGFRADVSPGRHTVTLVAQDGRRVSLDAVITER